MSGPSWLDFFAAATGGQVLAAPGGVFNRAGSAALMHPDRRIQAKRERGVQVYRQALAGSPLRPPLRPVASTTTSKAPWLRITGVADVYYRDDAVVGDATFWAAEKQIWWRHLHGCFRAHLRAGKNVSAWINHDPTRQLGSIHAGNLKFSDDWDALRYELVLADCSASRQLKADIDAGRITGVSAGWHEIRARTAIMGRQYVRELEEGQLDEISFVDNPKCKGTTIKAELVADVETVAARVCQIETAA